MAWRRPERARMDSGSAQPYGAHAFIHIAGSPGDVGSVLKDNVILDPLKSRPPPAWLPVALRTT
jgi:hypothetical protein